jgi:hypothetical protein
LNLSDDPADEVCLYWELAHAQSERQQQPEPARNAHRSVQLPFEVDEQLQLLAKSRDMTPSELVAEFLTGGSLLGSGLRG